jgi:8-oxo-dGTP pyrophosphatase MutT (NUDIX family)
MPDARTTARGLVAAIIPADPLEHAHQAAVLAWLDSTADVFRRAWPATPPQHLVTYAVLADPWDGSVFLTGHRQAGLWLPAGGHVEPGEDPASTVRRETREELGIDADLSPGGGQPVFLTVTPTAEEFPHLDVSLWFVLAGRRGMDLRLEPREFSGGRWWSRAELAAADPAGFDPHLARFLAKVPPGGP